MSDDRVIPLHGIHNLRDYGGYHARDGQRLKRGILWRSGQHQDATSDDLETVSRLNLRTIIDLRGDRERVLHPCLRAPGFDAEILFAPGETVGEEHAPHVEAAKSVRTAADAHAAMARLYKLMPFRPALVGTYRLYFDALADRSGASLLHCLAGKDRTGIAAALLHHLLGVHQDDIMADYLLTNTAGNIERRIAAGALTVRTNFGGDMDDAAIRTVMSVHPEYLDNAFAAIRESHGNIDAYADEVLLINAQKMEKIAAQLLE